MVVTLVATGSRVAASSSSVLSSMTAFFPLSYTALMPLTGMTVPLVANARCRVICWPPCRICESLKSPSSSMGPDDEPSTTANVGRTCCSMPREFSVVKARFFLWSLAPAPTLSAYKSASFDVQEKGSPSFVFPMLCMWIATALLLSRGCSPTIQTATQGWSRSL